MLLMLVRCGPLRIHFMCSFDDTTMYSDVFFFIFLFLFFFLKTIANMKSVCFLLYHR